MKVGSLFSGIGGFDLGLERAGYEIIWQVENNEFCRHVLKKHWPSVPCHYDIKSIDWEFVQPVDLVCGGFPCQPFSCAGKQRGAADDRYLWPEVVRCLAVLRPTWFLGENVPGLLHVGIDQVLSDLEALGYQTAVLGIPACAVDAPHIRQRLWILAYRSSPQTHEQWRAPECGRDSAGRSAKATQQDHGQASDDGTYGYGEDVADTTQLFSNGSELHREYTECEIPQPRDHSGETNVSHTNGGRCLKRQPERQAQTRTRCTDQGSGSHWLPEPSVGRVAHGVSNRVDRLKGLGNAVVPAIVETLGKMILQADTVGHL